MIQKGAIKSIQKHISDKAIERGFKDETLQERLLMLTEEIGELIKAARKANGMHTDVKKIKGRDSHIGEELADILTMLCWTAEGLGADLEQEFIKKDAQNDKRVWKRTEPKTSTKAKPMKK